MRNKNLENLKRKILAVKGDLLASDGKVHISDALTLIENSGLTNIEDILIKVRDENIEGDFVETGVWKGGASIFAKGVINEFELNSKVYVCDSFVGLPKPNVEKYPADSGDKHHTKKFLAISKETVQENFERFDLLDNNVIFVKGWFEDTMLQLKNNIEKISVLRLDGDMYGSTMVVLENLYDLVSDNGFIIIDDMAVDNAKQAVVDFRKQRNIQNELIKVNHTIYYWRKNDKK